MIIRFYQCEYKSNIQNDHIDLASCDPLIFVVSSFEPLLSPAVSRVSEDAPRVVKFGPSGDI